MRAGLRALLDGIEGVSVVAEANNGEEAVALAAQHTPDIALLDISMPGMNGLQAAERILRDLPDTRVLILSMHASEEYVSQALKLGVSGYLLKDAATLELQAALEAVASGATYLSPRITSQVLQSTGLRQPRRPDQPVLTARQLEVLKLLALGKSIKEIAFAAGTLAQDGGNLPCPDHGSAGHTRPGQPGALRHPQRPNRRQRLRAGEPRPNKYSWGAPEGGGTPPEQVRLGCAVIPGRRELRLRIAAVTAM